MKCMTEISDRQVKQLVKEEMRVVKDALWLELNNLRSELFKMKEQIQVITGGLNERA